MIKNFNTLGFTGSTIPAAVADMKLKAFEQHILRFLLMLAEFRSAVARHATAT
jgi:hypothetical protein